MKKRFSFNKNNLYTVKTKMRVFVMVTAFIVAAATSAVAFTTSVNQIDKYYKQCTLDNAKNFASLVDGDYLEKLRESIQSDEYQQLREKAEAEENEELIKDYLVKEGLWDKYSEIQNAIDKYRSNVKDIKYLYISVLDDAKFKDMYLLDASDEPLYETGFYEEREKQLIGLSFEEMQQPNISTGSWGWLCSSFSPVYNSAGERVCFVGCDFSLDDVMRERWHFLLYVVLGTLLFTLIVQFVAMRFVDKTVVLPLDAIATEMKKFKPAKHLSYDQAGVINLPVERDDEITAIYHGIRTMQINIMDRLNDLFVLQEDKLRAQMNIKKKEQEIDQLSEENNRDVLTGVGSKSAYAKKVDELNAALANGTAEFAIVMVDMNNLKQVNDELGHKAGDQYIKGCCKMVCDAYKHSPVFRIGGDEFIVVVQGSDFESRLEIFEKLKENFEKSYEQDDKELFLRYSASLGISENRSGDTTVDLVFRRADKDMYENKKLFKKEHGSYR